MVEIEGFVLNWIRYREKDRIVRMYCREKGLISFIVRAERDKKKGSTAALYLPFNILKIQTKWQSNGALHRISEAGLLRTWNRLHMDHLKSAQLLFLSELLVSALKDSEPHDALFEYLLQVLNWFELAEDVPSFHHAVAIGLCRILGFSPQIENGGAYFDLREGCSVHTAPLHQDHLAGPSAGRFMEACGMDIDTLSRFPVGRMERNELLSDIMSYYRAQMEHFKELNSHLVLQDTLC